MNDGIYFDLPEATYHAEQRLSSSGIRDILENPTCFWFNSNLNPLKTEPKSEAMTDGRIFHTMILENENFTKKFKVIPPEIEALNKNTAEFKMWKAAQSLELVPSEKFKKFKLICEYLKQDGQLLDCSVFRGGFSEVSIFWTEGGIPRKCRIDYLKENGIVDLKTFVKQNRSPLGLYVSQYFFGYRVYIQLIYYLRGLKFALNENLPIKGTAEQKRLIESLKNRDLMTMVAFVNRELPQSAVRVFSQQLCPDLWRLGERQIEEAENIYSEYLLKYGLKSAWLQSTETTADELLFKDSDFPQSFNEILQRNSNI